MNIPPSILMMQPLMATIAEEISKGSKPARLIFKEPLVP
jgi:hypothetical protein